jgi:hypothetical protein
MKARDLELAILTAVDRVRDDEWLPCSLGDLRNRLREVNPDAGNASVNSISGAAISMNQEGHLLLGKWEDGIRRLPFDLRRQLDEGYVSNFFCRGSFELKVTHQGRKHLEKSEQNTATTEPLREAAAAQKSMEAQKHSRENEKSDAPKEELPKRAEAVSPLGHGLQELSQRARSYFDDAIKSYRESGDVPVFSPGSSAAAAVRLKFEVRGNELASILRDVSLQVIEAASHSPIVPKADVDDLKITTRKMTGALRFREYTHYGSYVVHEEDRVYGIQPESSQEIDVSPEQAQTLFLEGMRRLREVVNDFIDPRFARRMSAGTLEGGHQNVASTALVLNVLISSPSDVSAECNAVESAIREWNANHHESRGIILHPVRWETHAYPAIGDRPQGILNKQIVKSAHFLIGIFGNRLGTPTGAAPSGTIEEVEEIRKSGRHVALYFSNAPVPRDVDRTQLDALENYQRSLKQQGLYFTFDSVEELRRLVTQHLPKIVDEVSTRIGDLALRMDIAQTRIGNGRTSVASRANEDLSPKEIELLWNAAKDCSGEILHMRTFDGESIRTNGKELLENADARTGAEWVAAFRSLQGRSFIEPLSYGSEIFRVTGDGYRAADKLEGFARYDAKSIVLRARYINAPHDEVTLTCKGIVAIPPRYSEDLVGADRSVQRSLKEPRTLLVEGIGPQPRLTWIPTEVEFLDSASSQTQKFRVSGFEFLQPSCLKLPIAP